MIRIDPEPAYDGLPCSIVAIGCALGRNPMGELQELYGQASRNNNYASLRSVNQAIRKVLKVKKYTYFTRDQRVTLKETHINGKAIVCVYGHFLYADFTENTYYSFFDNDNDKVVAIWEIM